MKKKTTASRKKAMIRKMKKQALRKERSLMHSEDINVIPVNNENIEAPKSDAEILKSYLKELTLRVKNSLDEEKATLKNKAKRFKVNSAAFLSKTISCLRKVKSIDDKTEKSLNYINRLIEKTGDFISKEKKSISFVLSMVFAMNNTAANGVENPNNYIFDEIVRPTLEDGLIPSVLDYSSEIEFLDVLPPDMNSEQTIELSSLYYSEKPNEQIDIISAEEKEQSVMNKENLCPEQLNILLELMQEGNCPFANDFNSREEALNYLYENEFRTYEDIMLIIMARDGYSYNELDAVCAGCVAEARGGVPVISMLMPLQVFF